MFLRVVLAASLLFMLASCTTNSNTPQGAFGHGSLMIRTDNGSVRLTVRIAATVAAQTQGLMGQQRLADEAGMVFTYRTPTVVPFTMKDTTIPLSIAFWSKSGRIVDMLDMEPCTSDPCPLYRATSPFVGAVEVNQGFFDRHEVVVGDTVELNILGSQ